ncbi:hypothetical protein FA95DRAFT_1026915 [Auriscalpium vulgare]|uniref:Uncharacterized protein n=1 Tax=Auriscalpium vulgare TaxID=40419 RepID=A0ACB8R5K3_9AGAM|nr:hypothetical protein FA95DRAFT_1026915 [Auriscalpium vulgare]
MRPVGVLFTDYKHRRKRLLPLANTTHRTRRSFFPRLTGPFFISHVSRNARAMQIRLSPSSYVPIRHPSDLPSDVHSVFKYDIPIPFHVIKSIPLGLLGNGAGMARCVILLPTAIVLSRHSYLHSSEQLLAGAHLATSSDQPHPHAQHKDIQPPPTSTHTRPAHGPRALPHVAPLARHEPTAVHASGTRRSAILILARGGESRMDETTISAAHGDGCRKAGARLLRTLPCHTEPACWTARLRRWIASHPCLLTAAALLSTRRPAAPFPSGRRTSCVAAQGGCHHHVNCIAFPQCTRAEDVCGPRVRAESAELPASFCPEQVWRRR